ncbi:prohibitin family protein [Ruegeria phage RpAliso]|nr:prohibitin family protein [Ruegeria phage RpAliso]
MKFFAGILAVLAFIGGIAYVSMLSKVEAGYVGIKVDLLGSEKGVDTEEVGVGRYLVGINEELFKFPTFSQNYVWSDDEQDGTKGGEGITFQSVEGMDIGADVGITYSIDPTKVSDLFQRYRKGIDEITNVYLRNMVRDALVSEASKMAVNSIYGTGKTELMLNAQERVKAQVAGYGIIIERVYWIGSLRLPQKVVDAIDNEISANSKARQRENEIAEAIAEAAKTRERAAGDADAILAKATAQAEANRLLADSLTPEVLRSMALEKWDGSLPRMTGDGPVPMISVDALAN